MKKKLRVLGVILGLVILGIAGILGYVKTALPKVSSPPDLKVELNPERIKHGEYLANHVSLCMDCHSQRDYSLWAGPIKPGTNAQGGEKFSREMGFPGNFTSKNITPFALKDWTDGEIFRAITSGVSKNGEPIFNLMPWENFGQMDKEDIYDIIAYIRTLPSAESHPETAVYDFPVNFIIRTVPHDGHPELKPAKTDLAAYGKYMVTSAGCGECHTKHEKGKITGEWLAGGFQFFLPDGTLTTPNITPDNETGIGAMSEAAFLTRFKAYADSNYKPLKIQPGQMQTIMPWTMYAGMDTTDLSAIYAYLRSIKPVKNTINKWTPSIGQRTAKG